ncbi:PREDICTED: serine carboxypeptidase-like 28 [Nelumbo nucifera]|uniref:Serine carboxypeptidase-like 28 n=1 Tax=Nelumbo nucifera TaxID=4432 RepID=A0A1U8Q471_NELNU|nr:PREDICTED: serine carboxypeptidase-like 28 [Nelumbo nucifera]
MRDLSAHAALVSLLYAVLLFSGTSAQNSTTSGGSTEGWSAVHLIDDAIIPQPSSRSADRVFALPGQPKRGIVVQYAGYVTVSAAAGRAFFYYFSEGPISINQSLFIWFNGGPGCSSFGNGAMLEHGPFSVGLDGMSLQPNKFSWSKVASVLYVDSPVGAGFSYSNSSSDYETYSDELTAIDNYKFLLNWLERFPEYKTRDVYLAGEGYAGHYVLQLAQMILAHNAAGKYTNITLKGLALGNAILDEEALNRGVDHYLASHGYISYRSYQACYSNGSSSDCSLLAQAKDKTLRSIYPYDITAHVCKVTSIPIDLSQSANGLYECDVQRLVSYLNLPDVKAALHVNSAVSSKAWTKCNENISKAYQNTSSSMLPALRGVVSAGLQVLLYRRETITKKNSVQVFDLCLCCD